MSSIFDRMAMEEHMRDAGTWHDVYSERYANETVGDPGADDEYFAEDYDKVHCVHGAFIGYPGGADFMCGLCESGRMYPKQDFMWTLYVYDKKVWTVYCEEETEKWDGLIALCDKSGVSYEVRKEEYTWWDDKE